MAIVDLGHAKHCSRCDGQTRVFAVESDQEGEEPDFHRSCLCTSRIELTAEELELAKRAYELRTHSLATMNVCGGWPAAGQ